MSLLSLESIEQHKINLLLSLIKKPQFLKRTDGPNPKLLHTKLSSKTIRVIKKKFLLTMMMAADPKLLSQDLQSLSQLSKKMVQPLLVTHLKSQMEPPLFC
jgi:hypothetical protein